MSDKILLFKVVGFASFFALTFSALTFYNIECKSFDKTFSDFEYCYIKAIDRSTKNCSVKVNIFKPPITKVSINLALSYRANGWKPFLYNYTFDACKFMKSKERVPFVDYIYKTFEQFTNLNHTCPYNHDVMVNNLSTAYAEKMWTKMLPTPEGQYRVNAIWFIDRIQRAQFTLYVKIS